MNELVTSLHNTLANVGGDWLPDIAEVGLDRCMEDGILREIPIVKTLYSGCKTLYNVRERNLLKQTICMIEGFRSYNVSEAELNAYKCRYESDVRYAEKELGRVLIILDRTIDAVKSRHIGRLYGAFVKRQISWERFCEMAEVTERLFMSDYSVFMRLVDGTPFEVEVKENELYLASRLAGTGVIIEGTESQLKTIAEIEKRTYTVTMLGRQYASIIFER